MKNNKKTTYKAIKTPICDFLGGYSRQKTVRAHMPGHKGKGEFNKFDITEIDGADSLYSASGIIAQSEKIAGEIFGANTYYSCEGSSLCIRAMVRLITEYAIDKGEKPLIWAGRNAHKAFLSAVALLGCDVEWLYPEEGENYLACKSDAEKIEKSLSAVDKKPTAIYLTSPDYLGNVADIKKISEVCHRAGVILAVDNAHGSYLKFLTPSAHPIDLGADICSDSAHKTLPALTGAAYLHISKSAPEIFNRNAKSALALFGSTSPSYLILRSLDRLNKTLGDNYSERLFEFCSKLRVLKCQLVENGYTLIGDEETKLTLFCKPYGYTGNELSEILRTNKIVTEFHDEDHVVMMFTAENGEKDIKKVGKVLISIPKNEPIIDLYPHFSHPKRILSIAEAYKKPTETVSVLSALGRISAETETPCPPAVPIVVAGELIDENIISALKYYKTEKIKVIKENQV